MLNQRSNPVYIGPGYWASWHIKSLLTDTKEKKSEVSRNIILDIENFPCNECREHAINHVKNNSLKPVILDSDPLSLFKWTVNFHNAVNLRLGKAMIDWRKAKEMWSKETLVCLENCGEEDIVDVEKDKEIEDDVNMVLKSY